jgi:hypothetical protein
MPTPPSSGGVDRSVGVPCGSGSDRHGTLTQWQAAFPNALLSAAGFSLGSGIKADGVIHDIQVGDTDYQSPASLLSPPSL